MRDFIKKHYGSQLRMSEKLGISNQTVTNWMKTNPRGMLKYLPEIVMYHEKELCRD